MREFNFKIDGDFLSDQTTLPKKLRVCIYDNPEAIWTASWPDELEEGCSFVGIDKNGNEIEYTDADGIAGINIDGCFGFVLWDKELHLWISDNFDDWLKIIALLGHEIGHMQRPHKRDFMAEEMKAEHYSDFAGYVFRMVDALKTQKVIK